MTHLRSILLLLLLCPGSIFALARLNVLEVNATSQGAPEIKFVTPACQVIQFQTGSDLSISARPHSSYLTFTGWNYNGRPITSTIRGNEYIEFECRLDAGAQQVTGIDVYASRNGSGAPTRLAIVAKAGRFTGSPTGRDIRGGMTLPRLGESPDMSFGKSFDAIPINPDSPVFTVRIYPDGTPAIDEKSSAREATVTIDALVIHSSTNALRQAVQAVPEPEPAVIETPAPAPPPQGTSPLDVPRKSTPAVTGETIPAVTRQTTPLVSQKPLPPEKPKAIPLVQPKANDASRDTAVPLVKKPEKKRREKTVEVQLRAEGPTGTPITLELGREVIENDLTPVGMIEGDAQLLSAGVGDGCEIALLSAKWLENAYDADFQVRVVAYRGWAPTTESDTMNLGEALRKNVYCEYTLQFGPSVKVINAVVPYVDRRGQLAPPRASLFTFNAGEVPVFAPTDSNGTALVYRIGDPITGNQVPNFHPIKLGANRTVTFRFYFWGHPVQTEYNWGTLFFDKIVFLTD